MKPPAEDYTAVSVARKWGFRMVAFWDCPEPQALTAVITPAPQVNVTVIVQSGAVLSFGGGIIGPRLIPAVPQQWDAITATPITEGEQQ